MSKLYVGNLPFKFASEDLAEMFAAAGQVVSALVITDRDTKRSKGFGFVEFASEEESNKAIEMLNGKEVEGRKLVVNPARPQVR